MQRSPASPSTHSTFQCPSALSPPPADMTPPEQKTETQLADNLRECFDFMMANKDAASQDQFKGLYFLRLICPHSENNSFQFRLTSSHHHNSRIAHDKKLGSLFIRRSKSTNMASVPYSELYVLKSLGPNIFLVASRLIVKP